VSGYSKRLKNLNLSGLSFVDSNASFGDFSNSNLANVDFSHANLAYANLSKSILTHADFYDANLSDVKLQKALFLKPTSPVLQTWKQQTSPIQ